MPSVTALKLLFARDALQGVSGELSVPFWGACGKNHQSECRRHLSFPGGPLEPSWHCQCLGADGQAVWDLEFAVFSLVLLVRFALSVLNTDHLSNKDFFFSNVKISSSLYCWLCLCYRNSERPTMLGMHTKECPSSSKYQQDSGLWSISFDLSLIRNHNIYFLGHPINKSSLMLYFLITSVINTFSNLLLPWVMDITPDCVEDKPSEGRWPSIMNPRVIHRVSRKSPVAHLGKIKVWVLLSWMNEFQHHFRQKNAIWYEYFAFSPWHFLLQCLLWAFLFCALVCVLEIKAFPLSQQNEKYRTYPGKC